MPSPLRLSPYLNRRLRSFAEAQADRQRHPVGVGRCERCIWRRVVCTNAKSPLRDKIVTPRDGCLAWEEGR